ncbi:MAG: hypothetical protein ACOCVP_06315 [Wenzhouxiangella sp.]
MSHYASPRALRDEIVGRTIAGVIARPGRNGEPPVVLMMRFDDGSVIEFVSPRSDRLLRRSLQSTIESDRSGPRAQDLSELQLTLDSLLWSGSGEESSAGCALSAC